MSSGRKSSKTNIRWTICIATVPTRQKQLKRLMAVLEPQLTPEVEVLIFYNNFEYPLGYLRQEMINEARGQYVSHIDDDDMVPEDFIKTILPKLGRTDYIGFRVNFYDEGVLKPPVYHTIKYRHWYDDDQGYYRGVTHLNPVLTSLARQSNFTVKEQTEGGEDFDWSLGMRDLVFTETYIDRPMYDYHHRYEESVAYTTEKRPFKKALSFGPFVRYHPSSTKGRS